MANRDEIRIGLIGAGNIGKVHLKAFQCLEGANICAISGGNLSNTKEIASQNAIEKVYGTAESLLSDSSLDAVIIAAPNKLHAPFAVMAMEAGKHVLLEKPMALDTRTAKEIVRTQRATGKVLMVAQQMRWQWNALRVKELADSGELGRIYSAKAGWLRRKGIPGWGTWFTRKSESGGGPLIDIGVHVLDLALYLMGNPKPVAVFGSTYAELGPGKKGIGDWGKPNWDGYFDVEDFATAIIKLDNGSTLNLDVSWAAHLDTPNEPFVHLLGSAGGASLVGNSAKILTEVYGETVDIPLSPPQNDEDSRIRLSRHFLDCIRNDNEPIASAITGLTNNLVVDAIFESSRTGREVKLDWSL